MCRVTRLALLVLLAGCGGGDSLPQGTSGAAPWVVVDLTRLDAERAEGHFEVIEGSYYVEPDDVCPRAAIEPFGFTVPVD